MSRVKQFILDVASPFRRVDQSFLTLYLNTLELSQLKKLRKAEVLHLIAVTKTLKQLIEKDPIHDHLNNFELNSIFKAALLHDVGKTYHPTGPINKTLVVLLNKIFKGKDGSFKGWKAWDVYKNHPEYGYQMVKKMHSFEELPFLMDLIRYHHKPNEFFKKYDGKERIVFDLFQEADEKN